MKLRAVLVDVEEDVQQPVNDGRRVGNFELTSEMLDQWVFGGQPEQARQKYEAVIKLEIEQIDAACGLSADQKQMLALAGAGELQSIRDSLDMLRAQYAGRSYPQDKMGEIFQQVQPIRTAVQRRPLDPSSLLSKLLQTTLDASQKQRLAAWNAERQRAHLAQQIQIAVAMIERKVPLRHSQRQVLTELLQAEAIPLIAQAEQRNVAIQPTSIIVRLNMVAPWEFEAFLDEAQWRTLKANFLPQYDDHARIHERPSSRLLPAAVRQFLDNEAAKRQQTPLIKANAATVPVPQALLDELQRQRKLLLDKANSQAVPVGGAADKNNEVAR